MSDKERLEQLSYRLAALIGAACGAWVGWFAVVPFAVTAAWSIYRYAFPKQVRT